MAEKSPSTIREWWEKFKAPIKPSGKPSINKNAEKQLEELEPQKRKKKKSKK